MAHKHFQLKGLLTDKKATLFTFLVIGGAIPPPATTLFIHAYSEVGSFEQSFFSLPDFTHALNLTSADMPLIEKSAPGESISFMFPWQVKIYSVDSGHVAKVAFEGSDDARFFRGPRQALPLADPTMASYQRWLTTWTPIVGFAVTPELILIETQSLRPLRYRLQIWQRNRRQLVEDIPTNRFLLGSRASDFLFVDGFPDNYVLGLHHPYELTEEHFVN